MKIANRKIIADFMNKYAGVRDPVSAWLIEAKEAAWNTPADIKTRYKSVSFLKDNYVIFNIKGNSYRLVTKIAYKSGNIKIIWIGRHSEYDKMNFP